MQMSGVASSIMADDCLNPDWSPSYGYQQGCRCDRCAGWRRTKDLEHRETLNARRRAKRRRQQTPIQPAVVRTSGRSATTFYNDVLDWWAGL
jgi:hypothetical protein